MARLATSAGLVGALALTVALLFGGHAFVNYDTAYALLWGRDLAHGRTPDLELPLAPTPHPLATLAGMVLDADAAAALGFVFLGLAGVLVLRLGQAWFGTAAGAVACLLFLTREPVLSFGLRAYVDVPYLCLVLAALLLVARRGGRGSGGTGTEAAGRSRDAAVLVLLALAGLLRPEAWLFSAAYVAWRRDWRLVPLAAAAPALWCLHDLLLTGEPLHSLTGTRENAQELGRRTGPVDLVLYGPRRLGEILREPLLVGLVAGAALAWRRRLWLPLGALALALGAFAVLATAGLPIITRYLMLPAALVCVLAAGALVEGLRALGRRGGGAAARPWLVVSVALLALLVAFAPAQVRRLDRLERSLGIQERILADLDALPADALRCGPVAVTNRRPVPHLALRFDFLEPRDIAVGDLAGARTYVGPSSRAVAERFIFDRRDPVRVLPRVPAGFRRVAGNASWTVLSSC
jgi:hypothetical protein